MDPALWRRIDEIYDAALGLRPEDRAAYLDEVCAGDEALRGELEELLAAAAGAERFLEVPALRLMSASLAAGRPDTGEVPFAPGLEIGPYRILARLGGGGMGEVYQARDTRLDRDVALKFLQAEASADAASLERFQREARAVSALNHPNICAIHDIGEYRQRPFLVLERLEGQSMKKRIAQGPIPWPEAVRIGIELTDALEASHKKGIIHRDIKPSNIFVTSGGQCKILDFGLAKFLPQPDPDFPASAAGRQSPAAGDTITRFGAAMGTAAYMAPEQARGEPVDARADLFSLGVTLYEMATGTPPFHGERREEILGAILNQKPAPPQTLKPSLPAELGRIILKALEKDRFVRYQSAAEMRSDLAVLNARAHRRPSRRAMLAAAIAGAAALVNGLLYFAPSPGGGVKSLAVLPFDNPSAGSGDEYLAEGLTEALRTAVATIRELRVISPTSAMRFKDSDKPAEVIARELSVDVLVKGSVARRGSRLQTRVELLDGGTGEHLWTESYERDFADSVTLQNEIARVIAREIGVAVSPREQARLERARAGGRDAFEAYFRGRHAWNKRTPEEIHKAIRWFQTAIDADPVFAPAYAGLADCYNQLGTVIVGESPPSKTRPLAAAAARRALDLDNGLAEAHAALAYTDLYNWNWAQAEAGFHRAIELNPSYASARLWYAHFLSARGRFEEALREVHVARDLDPLSPIIQTQVGWILMRAGSFEEALQEYRAALELDPNHVWAYWQIGGANSVLSRHEEAIAALETALELSGRNPAVAASLGEAFAEAGRKADAQAILDDLTALSRRRYVSPMAFVFLYLGMGDMDRVFERLEECYQERNNGLAYLAVIKGRGWERVRRDPRGNSLMRRIGFGES